MSTSIQNREVQHPLQGSFIHQSREVDVACWWLIHYIKRYRFLRDCMLYNKRHLKQSPEDVIEVSCRHDLDSFYSLF